MAQRPGSSNSGVYIDDEEAEKLQKGMEAISSILSSRMRSVRSNSSSVEHVQGKRSDAGSSGSGKAVK